jgi:Protein of unknown function (DUF2934)
VSDEAIREMYTGSEVYGLQQVADEAYFLAGRLGFPGGSEVDDWHRSARDGEGVKEYLDKCQLS